MINSPTVKRWLAAGATVLAVGGGGTLAMAQSGGHNNTATTQVPTTQRADTPERGDRPDAANDRSEANDVNEARLHMRRVGKCASRLPVSARRTVSTGS